MSSLIKHHRVNIESDIMNIEVPGKKIFGDFLEENDNVDAEGGADFDTVFGTDEIEDEPEETSEAILETARQEAAQIVADAQAEAVLLIEQARSDADEMKTIAREEGYQKGHQEALLEAADQADSIRQEANEVLENAKTERTRLIEQTEPEMVALIIKLLRNILGDAVKNEPDTILALIRKGFNESTLTTGKIDVHVSDADFTFVNEQLPQIQGFVDSSLDVEIIKDVSLQQGDCVIVTPYGDVDVSVDAQLSGMERELKKILSNR